MSKVQPRTLSKRERNRLRKLRAMRHEKRTKEHIRELTRLSHTENPFNAMPRKEKS